MRLEEVVKSTYLCQNHGRDLLRGESLGLFEVFDLNHGVAALVDDLEWP